MKTKTALIANIAQIQPETINCKQIFKMYAQFITAGYAKAIKIVSGNSVKDLNFF